MDAAEIGKLRHRMLSCTSVTHTTCESVGMLNKQSKGSRMQVHGPWVQVPGTCYAPEAAPVAPAGTEIMHGNVNTEPKFVFPAWARAPETPPVVSPQVNIPPEHTCAHHKKLHMCFRLFSALQGHISQKCSSAPAPEAEWLQIWLQGHFRTLV